MKTTKKAIVFMAGGLGSRYKGLKQIDGILENGSPILEYSLYDAIQAKFDNFVFIINKSIPQSYIEKLNKILSDRKLEHHFVIQQKSDFVDSETLFSEREKPWGTAHAVLCAKPYIDSDFVVINADDYYGKSSFEIASNLINEKKINENNAALIAYQLKNTLSENGFVARGLCTLDENKHLKKIEELTKICEENSEIFNLEDHEKRALHADDLVSMNFWIFNPEFFNVLEFGFREFLTTKPSPKTEYYLPTAVSNFMKNAAVSVLESKEIWNGVTYPEDKFTVQQFLLEKIKNNVYPPNLWI